MRSSLNATRLGLVNGPAILSMAVLLAVSAVLLALPDATTDALVEEHGPVEAVTVALWLAGAAAAFLAAARARLFRLEWLFGGILMCVCAARELSWHTAFTGWSVAKVENYFDPQIPVLGRLLALLLVVIPAAVSLLGLLVRLVSRVRPAWKQGLAWPRDAAVWILLAVASQILDKGHKVFPPLGLEIPLHYTRLFEEVIEMTLPLYLVLLLWPLAFPRRQAEAAAEPGASFTSGPDERAA